MNFINLKASKFDRRKFIQTLGLGAALLPIVGPERVAAQVVRPQRFMMYQWPNGVNKDAFFPSGGMIDATKPLLQPFAEKNLIGKMHMPIGLVYQHWVDGGKASKGHDTSVSLLTGTFNGYVESLDTKISNKIAETNQLPRKRLTLGVQARGTDSSNTSFNEDGQLVTQELDPYKLFNELFSGPGMPVENLEAIRARKQSLLDFVERDLEQFSARLDATDRVKVEAHLTAVRELETDLQALGAPLDCGTVDPGPVQEIGSMENFDGHLRLMSDLVAAAFACDVTRVVTLDPCDGQMNKVLPFIGKDWHDVAHAQNDGSRDQKLRTDTFMLAEVAYIADRLNALDEGGVSVLDNTLIYCTNLMEDGSSHYVGNLPTLLLGSAGGKIKTGGVATDLGPRPQNTALTAFAHAFGLDVPYIGDNKYPGVLSEILV